MSVTPVVIVHGGAGDVPVEGRARHQHGARVAADAGLAVIRDGGSSLDAVVAAVMALESDPQFNAGTGACLTEEATIELDASVMEGTTLRAGALTGLPPFLHPVEIARAILADGRHVFYSGDGAVAFARRAGFNPSTLEEMTTQAARDRLAEVQADPSGAKRAWAGGTVGAVAIDASGRLAAATSTGGMAGKRKGRVGDSPIIGAGTYADDEAGAGSATGSGEDIMRACLTRHACDLMRQGADAQSAANEAMGVFARRFKGSGGLILIDRQGRVGESKNTTTMAHAIARLGEETRSGL